RDGKKEEKTVVLEARSGAQFAVNTSSPSVSANLNSLGLSVQDADKATTEKYGKKYGVLVTGVTPGSEAENRGIQKGDLITSVDNEPVKTADELKKIVKSRKPGDALLFRVTTTSKLSAYLALEIPKK
ncbi:MAG: PDZ domain-containing protein, partial [Bacteroidetes bacterium]|nr:PDZ domain-containing protein [Bacteroidota bacterium]